MLRCAPKKSIKKPRKAASGHKEMLMPVECKKQANEMAARKTGSSRQRRSAWCSLLVG